MFQNLLTFLVHSHDPGEDIRPSGANSMQEVQGTSGGHSSNDTRYTFTAPASGKVNIHVHSPGHATNAGNLGWWAVLDTAGNIVAGTVRQKMIEQVRKHARSMIIPVENLTPSNSYTFAMGYESSVDAGTNLISTDNATSPFTQAAQQVEVWEVT